MTTIGPDGSDNIAGGDNGNLLRVTAKSNEWKWPSDMHTKTYSGTSTSQRDLTVLLLVIFQKIFRDKKSEYPIIALWGFGNIISALLIYLIGSSYWNPNTALLVSILYITSFWMWQMSLFVGHLNIGTMFFLLAVYFLTASVTINSFLNPWLFISGISFACMIYASSSSPRYIFSFFAAAFFARHSAVTQEITIEGFRQTIIGNHSLIISLILTAIFCVFLILIKLLYKNIITAAYERRAWFLNGLISAKKYPLEYYLEKAKQQWPNVIRLLIKPYVFIFLIVNLIGLNYFAHIFIGFMTVFFILNLPDIKKNFTFYFNYLYISYLKPGVNSGLVRYVRYGYFSKNHLKIPKNLRGGGFWWVPKIYFRMALIHTLIYILALAIVIFKITNETGKDWVLALLVLTSLLPILWAELTKAYQVSRSYSSGLIGFMVLIGFVTYNLESHFYFWPITFGLMIAALIWNSWKFFTYIYPARMSFNKIIKVVKKYGIKEIYTYDTFYNSSFLYNIELTPSLKDLKINFIKSIVDVQNGWIFIPATTHKAGYIRTEESIEQGDFYKDPVLNQLLETKKIEEIASAKFKTVYGSDDIWIQENDITSYMDLMLHYITERDRFRGYAWLLHSNKLKAVIVK